MSRLSVYIATSLDKYIARPNGNVDWLHDDIPNEYGSAEFFNRLCIIIMGHATYKQSRTFGVFPMLFEKNKKS